MLQSNAIGILGGPVTVLNDAAASRAAGDEAAALVNSLSKRTVPPESARAAVCRISASAENHRLSSNRRRSRAGRACVGRYAHRRRAVRPVLQNTVPRCDLRVLVNRI